MPFDEIVRLMGDDCDIMLTEGFSLGDAPKIEVHRKELGPLLKSARKRIAVVADEPLGRVDSIYLEHVVHGNNF